MYKHLIGKSSEKVLNLVERGAVKKFAEAIGDPHPIYIDREFASNTKYKTNIAPPTFPITFDYGRIQDSGLPKAGLIHGEQEFEYVRPLFVGEEVYCYSKVIDYYEKQGSNGTLGFMVRKNSGEDKEGNEIFSSKSIIIITETVRKGMKHAENLRT